MYKNKIFELGYETDGYYPTINSFVPTSTEFGVIVEHTELPLLEAVARAVENGEYKEEEKAQILCFRREILNRWRNKLRGWI